MATKVELNCEMTCDKCANKIRQACNDLIGITVQSIDVLNQQVLIEVAENAELSIPDLQHKIEDSTGLRTVIKGVGEGIATVSEFNGPGDLIGVIRLAQLANNRCLVDGVIDHVMLSRESNHCSLDIHEFGDLRGESFDHVGPVKVPIMEKVKPIAQRCLFRGNFNNCDLADVIGRSLVLKEQESNRKLSAAIIARVSPIYGNDKKICSCSGIFNYTDANLNFKLPSDKSFQTGSFDNLLEKRWNELQSIDGLFLFKFNSSDKKVIMPGKYKLLAQLNVGRGAARRSPQTINSTTLPFDGNKFNFTKIKPNELLFKVCRSHMNHPIASIIINNSPIEYCSSLMVIDCEDCLPQRLTAPALKMAIELCALSEDRHFRMGFNSLGAEASVNHCHWHLYYQKDSLYLESIATVSKSSNFFTDWPLPGFMFEITSFSLVDQVVGNIMKLVNHVYTHNEHSYNLFITRGVNSLLRVFIWIRKASFGLKNMFGINPAFCELSGFFICKTEEMIGKIDEKFCTSLIKSIEIDCINEYNNLLS